MIAPVSGALTRRTTTLFWGVGIVSIGLVVAFLLVHGNIRAVTLLLLTVLGILCLNPRRGVYIVLVFLPFMYFIRRQVLYFQEYSQRDPILLFPPLVTIAMFLGCVVFYSKPLYGYFRKSFLLKSVVGLLALFTLQAFNPLQGSILVGVAGGIYFIIPMLWIFMGQLLDERDIRKIFGLIVLIGVMTAFYGIYQHYFGFSVVEQYELESKRFVKTFGEQPRIMSTFAGLADFGFYMVTTGALCFAYYRSTRKNPLFLLLLGVTVFALLWVASRTAFLLLAFAIISFLIVDSKRVRLILVRGVVALTAVAALYAYLYTYTPIELYKAHGSHNPFVAHTVAGVTQPTEESSFRKRLSTWSYVVGRGVAEAPFGRGLGSTTTAATKFAGGMGFTVESYFFELIYGSGPLAAVLFMLAMVSYFRAALSLTLRFRDNLTYKMVIGLISCYFLGSLFGYGFRDTITGPLAWLLIGWTVREHVEHSKAPPDTSSSPSRGA